jgi:paraquat-inducible protein B
MSKQANPAVIGGFVLGAIVLVVIGLIVFGSGAWLRERIEMVTYFPGSVQGLDVGAQVQFQGVPVGQVTAISLDYLPGRESFRIPVRYEIWPKNVRVLGDGGDADPRDVLQRLVDEKGLRARLESISFVTGQYLVALSLNPELPKRPYAAEPSGPIRVPAMPATRDRIEQMLTNLDLDKLVDTVTNTLAAIERIVESGDVASAIQNLDATLREAKGLLATLDDNLEPLAGRADQALADYAQLARTLEARIDGVADSLESAAGEVARLARNLDGRIEPIATAATDALGEAGAAMRSVQTLVGQGSAARYQLERMLTEAGGAARALRELADYLQRHPEALIKGKR